MNVPSRSLLISVSTSIVPSPPSSLRRASETCRARMPGRPPPPFGAASPRFPLMSGLHFSVILCNPPLSSGTLAPPPVTPVSFPSFSSLRPHPSAVCLPSRYFSFLSPTFSRYSSSNMQHLISRIPARFFPFLLYCHFLTTGMSRPSRTPSNPASHKALRE